MKFAYYPGCSLEATAREFDLSARAAAGALGMELEELHDWNCCGATSAHSIKHQLALALPARNIKQAQEQDLDLVVPCAACYSRMRKADHALRNDSVARAEVEELLGFAYTGRVRVYSMLDAVVQGVGLEAVVAGVRKPLDGLKVACYYGCLLVRPPETREFEPPENPDSLDRLVTALGAEAVNWSYKTECCGASLSLTRSDVVRSLVDRILGAAVEAGAGAVVTACPLCMSNLEMRRSPDFAGLPVLYFTELIGLAHDLPQSTAWLDRHLCNPVSGWKVLFGV